MSAQLAPFGDLSRVPLMRNPHGAPPNFDDPPSLDKATYGITATVMILASAFVILRILSAVKKDHRLKVDDYFCVGALILAIPYGVFVMLINDRSRHTWDTSTTFFNAPWLKENAIVCIIYNPAMFFAKAAVCTLYLRIFDTIRWMRYTSWILLITMFCAYSAMIPVYILYVFPYSDEKWDLYLAQKMHKLDIAALFTGTFNVTTDIILLVLPLPIVIKLNLSPRKKLGLVAVFLTGILGTVATGLGVYYRVLMYNSKKHMGTTGDPMWAVAKTYTTVVVELYVTIMVSCVPGCVSSWRNVLRDTALFVSIRSFFNNSRTTISHSKSSIASSRVRGNAKSPSFCSDEIDLAPKYESSSLGRRDVEHGITKTVKIQQSASQESSF